MEFVAIAVSYSEIEFVPFDIWKRFWHQPAACFPFLSFLKKLSCPTAWSSDLCCWWSNAVHRLSDRCTLCHSRGPPARLLVSIRIRSASFCPRPCKNVAAIFKRCFIETFFNHFCSGFFCIFQRWWFFDQLRNSMATIFWGIMIFGFFHLAYTIFASSD